MDLYAHSTIRLHGVVLKAETQFTVHNIARFEVLTAVLSDCLALERKDNAVFSKRRALHTQRHGATPQQA